MREEKPYSTLAEFLRKSGRSLTDAILRVRQNVLTANRTAPHTGILMKPYPIEVPFVMSPD